jgi:hypothetical protein
MQDSTFREVEGMRWQLRRKTKRKQTTDSGGNQGGMWCLSHTDKDPSKLPQCQTESHDRHNGTASLLCSTIKRKLTGFSFDGFQPKALKDMFNFPLKLFPKIPQVKNMEIVYFYSGSAIVLAVNVSFQGLFCIVLILANSSNSCWPPESF